MAFFLISKYTKKVIFWNISPISKKVTIFNLITPHPLILPTAKNYFPSIIFSIYTPLKQAIKNSPHMELLDKYDIYLDFQILEY
jgi:hypothetical protein